MASETSPARRVVVGFSGGVTSAWCAGWALRNFPREEVVLLWHDTKEEHKDTYRFLREMASALDMPITERSDGRSVTELIYDENMLPKDTAPFCSRILKIAQDEKYIHELQESGVSEIITVKGFSGMEPERIQRSTAFGWVMSTLFCPVTFRFPIAEERVTKQECADWCNCVMGVAPSSMYEWSDHANCPGCVRGGKAYMLAVKQNMPEVFEQRRGLEIEFGHTFSNRYSLTQIETEGLKRQVGRKESITLGPCECGD